MGLTCSQVLYHIGPAAAHQLMINRRSPAEPPPFDFWTGKIYNKLLSSFILLYLKLNMTFYELRIGGLCAMRAALCWRKPVTTSRPRFG